MTPSLIRNLVFAVNGTALPEVNFDVGESYAGSLPISSNANDSNRLFFWFFPSENRTVGKEITIWLTGGVSKKGGALLVTTLADDTPPPCDFIISQDVHP